MSKLANTLEFKFERMITAAPEEVYDAWLDPRIPGNPWHEADKLILNPTVDGFFYWLIRGTSHYGRFTRLERGASIEHTWVSPYTLGYESTVTVTFQKKAGGTLMSLLHSDLPDDEKAKSHEEGWNYFLGNFTEQFGRRR